MLKTYMILVVLLVTASSLVPGFNVTIPAGTTDFDYSPDQQFIGILTDSALSIVSALTGVEVQNLPFPDPLSPRSFAFSRDSSNLAVGFENGKIFVYAWNQNKYEKLTNEFSSTTNSMINSVCFLKDKKVVVAALQQAEVVAYNFEEDASDVHEFTASAAQTVSCSPTDETQFFAGGGLTGTLRVEFLSYDFTEKKINSLKLVTGTGTIAQSSTYNGDGSQIYFVAGINQILVHDTTTYQQLDVISFTETAGKPFLKVRVSADAKLIASVVVGQIAIITPVANSQITTVGLTYGIELLPTVIKSVALSSRGQHLFYSKAAGQASNVNKCNLNEFVDQQGNCATCNPQCSRCEDAADSCYLCNAQFYLKGTACLSCAPGCLDCNENKCNQCKQNFETPVDFNCVCKTGFYIKGSECLTCQAGCNDCDEKGCKQCKPQFDLVDANCKCKKGSFPDGETCLACSEGCLDCKNADSCDACDAAGHYVPEGADKNCVCDADNKFVPKNNKCECQDGFYEDSNVCVGCDLGCDVCTGQNECTQCKEGLELQQGVCTCANQAEFVNDKAECELCSVTTPHCIQCLKANTCEECEVGSNRNPNNKCDCNGGFYEDGDTCAQCDIKGCLECSAADKCTLCSAADHWDLDPETSTCTCMQKYVEIENKCVSCPAGCLKCDVDGTCLECDKNGEWESDGEGKCRCIGGWFQEEEKCLQCQTGCLSCTDADTCADCDEAANFIKVGEKCECKATYYPLNRGCQLCRSSIPRCNTCKQATPAPICTQCDTPFVDLQNNCTCEKGQFVSEAVCSTCPEQCTACFSAEVCTDCQEDYDLEEGSCKKNGISTLVIVLIVVGVVLLAATIFVIIKFIKKRKTPLASEDYDELE